jgi:hypothetical protein
MGEIWTSQRTPISWASISVMDTSSKDDARCSLCGLPAATPGQDFWRRRGERCLPASSVFCVHQQGCTMVKSTSKHWTCLFPQHGPGRKHTRKIELEQWQSAIVHKYPAEFVRGLFHSDGCRSINRVHRKLANGDRNYAYPRYLFSNKSADILQLCGETLDELEVAWRFSRPDTISVARREAVARLDEFVGPKY